MKLSVAILLSLAVAIHGAALQEEPISTHVDNTTPLFTAAWEMQAKLTELQRDINVQLAAVRTSVTNVLRSSSNETVGQIEGNVNSILALDDPVRDVVFALGSSFCAINLKVLLNGVTEFTGFESSNCVTRYDLGVEAELEVAYAMLQKYEGLFREVQQIVVKSFVGMNVFTSSDGIQARFEDQYNEQNEAWLQIRPDIEDFVKALNGKIADLNNILGGCFSSVQTAVKPAYVSIVDQLPVCEEFDNTADPFASFRIPV